MEVAVVSLTAPLSDPRSERGEPPSWSRGLALRIGAVFWTLSCLFFVAFNATAFGAIPLLPSAIGYAWRGVVFVGARYLLGITSELSWANTGSGDQRVSWLSLCCIAVLA
ncbi:MAG TPA: hypothetical protein VGC42_18175, partial [Kofleriaceae bacterium]